MAPSKANRLDKTTIGGRGTEAESAGKGSRVEVTILYHPFWERVGERAIFSGLSTTNPTRLSRTEPAFAPPGQPGGEPLGDEHLSRRPLLFFAAPNGGIRLDLGDSGTSVVIRGQKIRGSVTFDAAWLRSGVVLDLSHRVVLLLQAVTAIQESLGAAPMSGEAIDIVGASDSLQRVLWEVRSVADLPMPVLLRGETGSGKELVARAIHQLSSRRKEPFVPVNLGAIPPSLAPSMLFGAEPGAYTGAVKRQPGYFEQARGGTLFLDEIGEAPVEVQVALLRVLETGEMQTVGARGTPKTSARVVAATDADLKGKVDAGTFRKPLLNRLSAYEICVPSLRERRDDIGRLLVYFLREEIERVKELHRLKAPEEGEEPWLPASLVARLAEYNWPGNVRQLRSVVQQLVIGNRGRARVELTPAVKRMLDESDPSSPPPAVESSQREESAPVMVPVPPVAAPPAPAVAKPSYEGSSKLDASPRKPADVTEAELEEALRASRWDYADAAKLLQISRASIYVLLERFPRFRTAGGLTPEEITRCHQECGGDIARMAERLEVSERALARRVKELRLK